MDITATDWATTSSASMAAITEFSTHLETGFRVTVVPQWYTEAERFQNRRQHGFTGKYAEDKHKEGQTGMMS